MSNDHILYNKIGPGYNYTRQADPFIIGRLFELLSPKEDKVYIDIGCGTGNYTIQLAQKGMSMIGIDPSEEMLKRAREKSGSVKWLLGSAENIPTSGQLFDGGIATLTIHHWTNLEIAFEELFRVLQHGGRLIILTSTPEQMSGYWLNHYFPRMMADSIKKMPGLYDIESAAAKTGFDLYGTEKYSIRPDLQDHFLFSGKLNPAIYFDRGIRQGISSFTSLSNENEIKEGLKKLKTDTLSESFETVNSKFENNSGDYLFIILKKRNAY